MSCPACNSNNISSDEGVTVCESCGTVIDEVVFQNNDFGITHTNSKYLEPKTPAGKHKSAIDSIDRIATYFGIPEEYIAQAKNLIRQHEDDISNRTPLETALFVTFMGAREWLSPLSIADFIEDFPIPVDIAKVQRVNFIFAQKSSLYRNVKFESSQIEADRFLDIIMPGVKKQYGGPDKLLKSTKIKIKQRAKALVALGDLYGLNCGKKSRPILIVAAIISHASLKIHNSGKMAMGARPAEKVSLYHDRRLHCFKKYCSFGPRILKMRMFEYNEFLEACAKNIPWIKNPKKQYVHYYLQDILELYGHDANAAAAEAPHFKLTDEQYSIAIIKKHTALTNEFEALFLSAQQHIDNETIPPDPQSSLLYSIYHLMTFGVTKQELVNWTKGSIRSMADALQFREKYGTDPNVESDLDRPELDGRDMLDKEVQVYIG